MHKQPLSLLNWSSDLCIYVKGSFCTKTQVKTHFAPQKSSWTDMIELLAAELPGEVLLEQENQEQSERASTDSSNSPAVAEGASDVFCSK